MRGTWCRSWESVLVEDDECGDDARHPSNAGKEENNEHRPAPAVDDGEGRENDGEEDTEEGHGDFVLISKVLIILQKYLYMA